MKERYLIHLLIMLVVLGVESAQKYPYVGDPIPEGINKGRCPIIHIDPLKTIHSEESSEVESSPSPISRKAIVERAFRPGSISPILEESFQKKEVQKELKQETCGRITWIACRTFFACSGCLAWAGIVALYTDYVVKTNNGYCFPPDEPIW